MTYANPAMAEPSSLSQLTPDGLAEALRTCIEERLPLFVWGSPGIGKSDIVHQVAARPWSFAAFGNTTRTDSAPALLIDIRASQWDPVDTRGVPYVEDMLEVGMKTTRWAIPGVLPDAALAAQYPVVIIFLDELNAARDAVQAALYQLVLDRRLGDYVLPENVVIVAAGNLETDRAVTHRMSTALASRFVHVQLVVDNRAWESWAINAGLHIAVPSFMRLRPKALHEFDPRSSSKAQPAPRTWEMVSRVVQRCEQRNANTGVRNALIAGAVGHARGAEFAGFLEVFLQMQDPDDVIAFPDKADIDADPAVNHAMCGALAERSTKRNFDRVLRYAVRLGQSGRAGLDFMAYLVRAATLRHPEVKETRAFIDWAVEYGDLL